MNKKKTFIIQLVKQKNILIFVFFLISFILKVSDLFHGTADDRRRLAVYCLKDAVNIKKKVFFCQFFTKQRFFFFLVATSKIIR